MGTGENLHENAGRAVIDNDGRPSIAALEQIGATIRTHPRFLFLLAMAIKTTICKERQKLGLEINFMGSWIG